MSGIELTWQTPNCTYCGNALPNCIICLQHVEPRFRAGRGDEADWNAASPDPIGTSTAFSPFSQ